MNKIDLQKIANELEFDVEDVAMLLEVFLDSAKNSLQALRDAIDTKNRVAIFSFAHAIKGSAANLTLNEIAELARGIEKSARESKDINYLDEYKKLKSLIANIES